MSINSSTLNFYVLEDGSIKTQRALLGRKVSHDGTYFTDCVDQLLENEEKWKAFDEKKDFYKELMGLGSLYGSMNVDYSGHYTEFDSPRYEYIPPYSPLSELGGHYPYLFSNAEKTEENKILFNGLAFYAGTLSPGFKGGFNNWYSRGEMWDSEKYGFDYIKQELESKEIIINTSDEQNAFLSMKLISVRQLPDIDINDSIDEEEVKQEMLSEAERYYKVNIVNSSYRVEDDTNFIDFQSARDYPTTVVIASKDSDLKFDFESGTQSEHPARKYTVKKYAKSLNEEDYCYYYRIELFHAVDTFTNSQGDELQSLKSDVVFSFCSNSHKKIPFTMYVEGVWLTKKQNWTYTLNNLSWYSKETQKYFSDRTTLPIIDYEGKATLQYYVRVKVGNIYKLETRTDEIDITMRTDSYAIYPVAEGYEPPASDDGKYKIILPTIQI